MGRKRKMEMANSSFLNESSNSSQTHLNIVQRCAANDRERTRMRVLSKAFVKLKTSLPWVPSDTKLSKLDTLKLATSYIAYLTKILEDDDLNAINLTQQPPLDASCPIPPAGETKTRHSAATNFPGNRMPVGVSSSNNPPSGFVSILLSCFGFKIASVFTLYHFILLTRAGYFL